MVVNGNVYVLCIIISFVAVVCSVIIITMFHDRQNGKRISIISGAISLLIVCIAFTSNYFIQRKEYNTLVAQKEKNTHTPTFTTKPSTEATENQDATSSKADVSAYSAEKIIVRYNDNVRNSNYNLSSEDKQEMYVSFDRQQNIPDGSGMSYEYANQDNLIGIVIFEDNTGEAFFCSIEIPNAVLNRGNTILQGFMQMSYFISSAYNNGMSEDAFMNIWRNMRNGNNKTSVYNYKTYQIQDDGQYTRFLIKSN